MYLRRVGESFQHLLGLPNSFSPLWSLTKFALLWSPQTMSMKIKIYFDFCLVWFFFSSLYKLLCLVPSLEVPGIPLATGKQQDCLLYLVTIATGLECEAITVALYCAEERPVACTMLLCVRLPESWHVSADLCCFTMALIAFCSRESCSGALIYWERGFLAGCRWWHISVYTQQSGCTQGKRWFPLSFHLLRFGKESSSRFYL